MLHPCSECGYTIRYSSNMHIQYFLPFGKVLAKYTNIGGEVVGQ